MGQEIKMRDGISVRDEKQKRKALMSAIRILPLLVMYTVLNICILYGLHELKEYESFVSLSYPPGNIGETAFNQWRENEGSKTVSAAVWKSCGEKTVSSETAGRTREVSCYKIKGQPGAIFGKELTGGRYFTEGEKGCCLIDRDTAWHLFGSDHIEGLEVSLDADQHLKVTGILKEGIPLIVLPAEEGTSYDAVTVRKKGTGYSSNLAVSGMEASIGGTDGLRIDGKLYYVAASLLYAAVISCLFLIFAGKFRRRVLCLPCIGCAVLVLAAGAYSASPGSDYLPAYWSDFDFFARLIKEKGGQIQKFAAHQEFSVWQGFFRVWRKTLYAEVMLFITGLYAVLHFHLKKLNNIRRRSYTITKALRSIGRC